MGERVESVRFLIARLRPLLPLTAARSLTAIPAATARLGVSTLTAGAVGENVCGPVRERPIRLSETAAAAAATHQSSIQADIQTVQTAELQRQVSEGRISIDQGLLLLLQEGTVIGLGDQDLHGDGGHGEAGPALAEGAVVEARAGGGGRLAVAGQAVQGDVRDVLTGTQVQVLQLAQPSRHAVPAATR